MLAGKRKSESKRENKNVNEDQVKKRNTESHALEVTLDVLISLIRGEQSTTTQRPWD